jgi:hypothetical protein
VQVGDLVFVECTLSVAMGSHRCDELCPVRGLAVIMDTAARGCSDRAEVQVLDSDDLKWIDREDCHSEWEINEVSWIEDFREAG